MGARCSYLVCKRTCVCVSDDGAYTGSRRDKGRERVFYAKTWRTQKTRRVGAKEGRAVNNKTGEKKKK